MYPGGHEQVAVCSRHVQIAPRPQMLLTLQGSLHFQSRQAVSEGQSELIIHSGWQPVCGLPIISGKHVHTARFPDIVQRVFGPQGDGWHGFLGGGGTVKDYISQKYAPN